MERRTVTSEQVEELMRFIEERGDLVLNKDRTVESRALCRREWDRCAAVVNMAGGARTGKDWAKYWCELKCRVRAKLTTKPEALTDIEERVAVFVRKTEDAKQDRQNEQDEDIETDEMVLPHQASSPQSPAVNPRSPIQASPRPSAQRRTRLTETQATQYSPSVPMRSIFAHMEERQVRMEERRARLFVRRSRMEERRARTDEMLAQVGVQRADAAVLQAEAARAQATALAEISHTLQTFVDMAGRFFAQLRRA